LQSPTSEHRSSPLEFAPFIPSEPSQPDYNSTTDDFLLLSTRFDWEMANMWMPNFAPDPWASEDPMGLLGDASMGYG
jgi:hypothetical protein